MALCFRPGGPARVRRSDLPSGPTSRARRCRGGGSGLSLETIVQFDWEVALGDRKLTLRELEALARMKAPLVRVRGQWVEMNAAAIQAAIDFWKKKGAEKATFRDIIQMALGTKDPPQGFDFNGTAHLPSSQRYYLTANGTRHAAELLGFATPSDFVRAYPVSREWLTLLIHRMDAVAANYRSAASMSPGTDGRRSCVEFHRRGHFDATIILYDGRSFGVVARA